LKVKVQDDRMTLPPLARYFIITAFGVVGFTFFINDGAEVGVSDSMLMLRSIIVGALTSYGFVNLIINIKNGRTLKGTFKEIVKTLRQLLYD